MTGQQNSYSLIERTIGYIKERRARVLRGDINCIPINFTRFRKEFPGIEQGVYYLISGITKGGKTQITSYIFVYNSIFYAYYHPEKLRVKIFYYPLEETPEAITLRFMSYILYVLSDGKIRVGTKDLKSTNENNPLSNEVIALLESEEYQNILKYFEDHVIFMSDRNPTGIWKTMKQYAVEHGTIHNKKITITKDNKDMEVEAFDFYEPDDPNEYVMCLTDHVSLLETESGMDLRKTINKFSEYMIILRNKFKYIPVVVQQQSTETSNLEAFKAGKIRPTMAGLSDSKYTGKDCTVMLGITNPHSFELPEYLGYDITKFRGNIRFLEVVLNREGQSNGICPLYFDGACNYFKELPSPKEEAELMKFYNLIAKIRGISNKVLLAYSANKNINRINLQRWNIKHIFAVFKNKFK